MTACLHVSGTRIRCDEPGCRRTYPTNDPLYGGHRLARRYAAEMGWVYDVMRGDFCPKHSGTQDRYIPGDCDVCDGWHPDNECPGAQP